MNKYTESLMKLFLMKFLHGLSFWLCTVVSVAGATIDRSWLNTHYEKTEVMIPMRDDTHLYTSIYSPKQFSRKSPILIRRTPYGCAYDGNWERTLWREWHKYAEEGFILVFQDVRGKGRSEGQFVDIRPLLPKGSDKKMFDESTDVYDTVEWLLAHIRNHNGRVGLSGSSYSGFYAMQGALCGHPAIKVAVPQAPVFSWYRGDDFHHNGVFFLRDAFSFLNRHCRPRPAVGKKAVVPRLVDTDEYTYYLGKPVSQLTALLNGEVPFWDEMCSHPQEDAWWQERDYSSHLSGVQPAIMVVGGLWDAEDYYGACQLYKNLVVKNPSHDVRLVIGPWQHGGWNNADRNSLGEYSFGEQQQALYYQEQIEYPFVCHYLLDETISLSAKDKVHMFITGTNEWTVCPTWPLSQTQEYFMYLSADGTLTDSSPSAISSSDTYLSLPSRPVPYRDGVWYNRTADYMTADQRFAATRPDVLVYTSEPLDHDLVLVGEVDVDLYVSLSTTDADFVVKVIDVYPSGEEVGKGVSGTSMSGYQLPVRMDIFRGRYREGFTHAVPFVPGQITRVSFTLQSISHTFRKGHSLAVQVQSSWFPLADMNPQQCVDIYTCGQNAFVPCQVCVYHQQGAASRLSFRRWKNT